MKKLLVFFCMLCSTFVQAQTEKFTESEIKEVKVYLSGALISRTAKTTIEPGITKLMLNNLSPYINQQSISVKGAGTGDVNILSVQYQLNYLTDQPKTPELKALEDSLQKASDVLIAYQNDKYVLDQEESLLLENKKVNGKDGVSAAQLTAVADVFVTRLAAVKDKQAAKTKQLTKQQQTVDKLNRQINSLKQKFQNGLGTIVVTVKTNAHASVNLDFSYLVNNAQWTPFYDLRCTDTNTPLQLAYKANVWQACGEDWDNVKLKLSTGNPSISGTKPELYSWYLNIINPQPVYKSRGSGAGAAPSMMKSEDKALKEVVVSGEAYTTMEWSGAEVSQNQLSNDFEIKTNYNIPSDNKQYLVEVTSYSIDATYKYSCTPKLDRDVFLTALVKDWEQYNLLSGDAAIYFQDTYVGTANINTVSTEDTLTFSLGRDKRIVVNREKQKDLTGKQFMGNNITKNLAFEISVKNTKKEPVTVTIEDQLPISQNSDIEVKAGDLDNANFDAATGKLTWVLTIAPSETQKKKFSFSVKYPKGKLINL